jgi:nucleotide-binding universal stress UspA family protein
MRKERRKPLEEYHPETILLATDGSEGAEHAARAAIDLSKRTGAKLHAAHAWVPPPHFAHPGLVPERHHPPYEEGARRILDEQLGRIEKAGDPVSEAHLVEGRPADAILDLAERICADLIVVGSRGLGSVKRLLVGSVSLGIVHHADRPVLVVRGRSWPPVRVVIGEDLSEDARGAVRIGLALGKLLGAQTLLAHAYEGMPPHPETLPRDDRELYEAMVEKYLGRLEPALEARVAQLEDTFGVRPRVRLLEGESARVLSEAAEEGGGAGLLVVGSRGLGAGGRMLLGSVSTKVLMAASEPVLVCPHEESDEGGRHA